MKEFVLAMDIITTFSTEEIIKQNKCVIMFLDEFLLKQNIDKKVMIIEKSVLGSQSTSDDDNMNIGASKLTRS